METNKLRNEEMQKTTIEERLEKSLHDLHTLKNEHMTVNSVHLISFARKFSIYFNANSKQLSEYLVRLSRALEWSECTAAPAPGADTTLLAETLLERAERITGSIGQHHDHHHTPLDHKHWDTLHSLQPHLHGAHAHPHHFKSLKLRRERSCHDLPNVKESTAMYNLQRRVHALKDQLQRKDLQIDLLKRKLALMEEGVRGKCIIQV